MPRRTTNGRPPTAIADYPASMTVGEALHTAIDANHQLSALVLLAERGSFTSLSARMIASELKSKLRRLYEFAEGFPNRAPIKDL